MHEKILSEIYKIYTKFSEFKARNFFTFRRWASNFLTVFFGFYKIKPVTFLLHFPWRLPQPIEGRTTSSNSNVVCSKKRIPSRFATHTFLGAINAAGCILLKKTPKKVLLPSPIHLSAQILSGVFNRRANVWWLWWVCVLSPVHCACLGFLARADPVWRGFFGEVTNSMECEAMDLRDLEKYIFTLFCIFEEFLNWEKYNKLFSGLHGF